MGDQTAEESQIIHTEVSTEASSPVLVPPDAPFEDKLAFLKSSLNLKTAVQVETGEDATPPDVVKRKVAPRPYVWNRQAWYETLSEGNWWKIQRDRETSQIWVATVNRTAKEFKAVEEAQRFVDQNEG